MSFQETAESWRAKLHLGTLRLPVLIGLTAAMVLVLGCVGKLLFDAVTADGFAVEKASSIQKDEKEDADQGSTGETPRVLVHVSGAVVSPGVYEVPENARVNEAVVAAGGFVPEAATDACNLARVVVDGEHIIVPTVSEVDQASSSSEKGVAADGLSGASSVGGRININLATVAELDSLPGVGASTAEKIIADREANGPFKTPEDLKRVSGIGDKKFAALVDRITVG